MTSGKTIRVDDEVYALINSRQDEELKKGRQLSKSEIVKILMREREDLNRQ